MKTTPLNSIRKYCLWCCGENSNEVALCACPDCSLFNLRFGKGFKGVRNLKAIKERCKDCGEGTAFAIKNCECPECQLYPYRKGHNPARKGQSGIKRPKGVNPFAKPVVGSVI